MLREALIREVKASDRSLRSLAIEARIHPTAMGRFTRGMPGYGLSLRAAGRLASVLGLVLARPATGQPGPLEGTPAVGPSPGALHTDAVHPGEAGPEDGGETSPGLPADADAPLQDLAPVARNGGVSRENVARDAPHGMKRFLAIDGSTKRELGTIEDRTEMLARKQARDKWPKQARFLKLKPIDP